MGHLVSREALGPHPLFSVGVKVNAQMRPLDERGEPCFDNLWVAGSLIGGYDAQGDGAGIGVAIGTGKLAGQTGGN